MKRLVEAGLGVALLPESAIDEELRIGSLATIPVADLKVANPVYAVVRRGGYLSPATLNLLALLRTAPGLAGRSVRSRRALTIAPRRAILGGARSM
jgi:DNA-binding transcriptional LysR family regulator